MEDMCSAIEYIYKMGGVKARKRGYIKKQPTLTSTFWKV
jgi:hypothetical protein